MTFRSKDFWKLLCCDLGYRNYFGVTCLELKKLYESMDSKLLHYVPCVNFITSSGLLVGGSLVGEKCVLLSSFNDILLNVGIIKSVLKAVDHFLVFSIIDNKEKLPIECFRFDGNLCVLSDKICECYSNKTPLLVDFGVALYD